VKEEGAPLPGGGVIFGAATDEFNSAGKPLDEFRVTEAGNFS